MCECVRRAVRAAQRAAVFLALTGASATAADLHVPAQYPTIQGAVDAAANGDVIIIADGVYTGPAAGAEVVDKSVTIRSASGDPAACVLDCANHLGIVLYAFEPTMESTAIEGLTIRNADWSAVFTWYARVTLRNCILTGNSGGPGPALNSYASNVEMSGCLVADNNSNSLGGGVYLFSSVAWITDSAFLNNTTESGGGVTCKYTNARIERCRFEGNTASGQGGGIYSYASSPVVIDCTVVGNSAAFGGGLALEGGGFALVADCLISDNEADLRGGGAGVHSNTAASFIGCRVLANAVSDSGGGLFFAGAAPMAIANCIIAGNVAGVPFAGDGGGICASGPPVSISGCTFSDNVALGGPIAGGALHASLTSAVSLSNSVVRSSTPAAISVESPATIDVRHSDITGGWPGVGNIDANPVFLDPDGADDDPETFADNDYRLAASSPCIDAGANASVPADTQDLDDDGNTSEPLPFDLLMQARFVDDPNAPDTGTGELPVVDMGAFERHRLGDCDNDWDVDAGDFAGFDSCMSGTGVRLLPGCVCSDMDADRDVDLADVAWLQIDFGIQSGFTNGEGVRSVPPLGGQ